MFCQVCGSKNPEEQEFCLRCHHKLLVLSASGQEAEVFEEQGEEGFSLDEHLLERVSILEEALKRTAEMVSRLSSTLAKQEKGLLVGQIGLGTLRELLEKKELVGREEWDQLWEHRLDHQLAAFDKRERFASVRERVTGLFQGDRRQQFLQNLEEAESAFAGFEAERALRALEIAFKLDRGNYELAFYLGETLFNDGDSGAALAYFGRVLEVKPDHYEALVYSGVLHHERGDAGRAEELLRRAVARFPDNFLPNFALGAVAASAGSLTRAVPFLEKAVTLEPVPQALYLLGTCYYEMGRTQPAIRCLREAVRLDPSSEEAHHLLGLLYLDRHWTRLALDAFREAQRLNPKKLRYQDLVDFLSGQAGSPLPEVGGEVAGLLGQAEGFLSRDEPGRALACYRRALTLVPDHPTVLMSYALACLSLDRHADIQGAMQKVLDQNPGEMLKATASAALIAALRSEGKYREGNRIGNSLLAEGSSDFAKTIAYYEMAYNLAEMEEDLDRALDFARRSLDLAPEELKQFPLAALGWVHYKRREFPQAVECLKRSSELGPSATTLTHLGMALLAAGEEDRARGAFARARSLQPRVGALEETMMQCMRDSTRLLARVQKRRKG